MPNTLGLDDDLDGVEVVRDLERIFDIKVSNEEAERIFTVGEFHDLLLSKLSPNEADKKCATAITFYRIRRAQSVLGGWRRGPYRRQRLGAGFKHRIWPGDQYCPLSDRGRSPRPSV